ncbi:MAG: hypothetical protein HY291_02000 [Planctomycetes bacterium]|nr:hypothetical protein [Planctomycetota bacterium]
MNRTRSFITVLSMLAGVFALAGCGNTKWAERKANVPYEDTPFAGFTDKAAKNSERKGAKYENVSDDTEPAKAVDQLVQQMQSLERHVAIPSEDELRYWASKQGVAEIVVRKVRPLLKNPRIEVRAPALRLTVAYGKKDSLGDLIEVLEDNEYGMRSTAIRTLKAKANNDFGYNPAGGDLARAQSIEKWRQWLKTEKEGPAKAGEKEKAGAETADPRKPGGDSAENAPPTSSKYVLPKEDPQPKGADTAKADPNAEIVLPAPKGLTESH